MKKILLYLLVIILFKNITAQEILFEGLIPPKSRYSDSRKAVPIIDSKTKCLNYVLLTRKNIQNISFDGNFKILHQDTLNKPGHLDFLKLLSGKSKNNDIQLLFSSSNQEKFLIYSFKVQDRTHKEIVVNFNFDKGEKFLHTFTHNNKFHFITIIKNSSILKFYILDEYLSTSSHTIDLSSYEFSEDHLLNNLHKVIKTHITPIDFDKPSSLDLTKRANKIYQFDNKIHLTINKDRNKTVLVQIDLNTFEFSHKVFTFKVINDCNHGVRSNSFLYYNHLFHITGCSEGYDISIYNTSNKDLIKSYRINEGKPIEFKNTPIIQEHGQPLREADEVRELKNTNQLIRKMNKGAIGLSVYQKPKSDNIELTVGASKALSNKGVQYLYFPLPAASLGSFSLSINITLIYFETYSKSKASYFKSLLETSKMEQIGGSIEPNAFDKMNDFFKVIEDDVSCKSVFKHKNYFISGYYDRDKKKYYLRKFTD